MVNLNIDVKPKSTILTSAYVDAPFDKGKEELEAEGFEVIGLRDNAFLRMQEGADSYVSQNGNWTREGVVYVPKKGIYLVKNSPIMVNAKKATDCYRNEKKFYLTDEQFESALVDSIKLSGESIPTNRFADNEVAVFAFGNSAEAYGNFLKENGIKNMSVYLANLDEKTFARQLWFHGLVVDSELGGDYRFLNCDDRVRGVRSSGEASTQKISEGLQSELYTAKNFKEALNRAGIVGGIEKAVLDSLKK